MSELSQTITDDLANYYQLWKVADAMDRVLKNIDPHRLDFCGGNCGGSCPLCLARKRFAPTRPCVVLRTYSS